MTLALFHADPNTLREISESHLVFSFVLRHLPNASEQHAVAMPMSRTSLSPQSLPVSPKSMPPAPLTAPTHCQRCNIHFTHPSHLSDHQQWRHGSNFTFISDSDDNHDNSDADGAKLTQPDHTTVPQTRRRRGSATLTRADSTGSTASAQTSRSSTSSAWSIQSPATTALRWKALYGRGCLLGGRDVLSIPQQRLTELERMELGRRYRRRRKERTGGGRRSRGRGILLSELGSMRRRKMVKTKKTNRLA